MWKLGFLVTAWLVHAPVFSQDNSSTNLHTKSDLEAEFDRIAEDFLSSFSLAHSKTTSRRKRGLDTDLTLLVDDAGVYRLQTVVPISQLCSPAVYSKFLDIESVTYAICATEPTAVTAAEVFVGIYRDDKWYIRWRWYVGNPNGLAAFYFNGYIYVLVADTDKGHGTALIKINIATLEMEEDHVVYSSYASSISIWGMKVDNKNHMAIVNSAGYQDTTDLTSEIFLYEWMGTYFDKYTSFRAYDVKDIEPFHIHGAAYLAVANYRKGKNDYQVDSEILKFNMDKKNWISHQKIRTYGAMDWEFFTLGSGTSQEFYLAVANKEGGVSDIQSIIYKFVKDRFVPFQCLPTSSAISIASWSSESMFLLAIANVDAVYLYQYDGWQFVMSGVQYTQGSMSFGVAHLEFYGITKYGNRAILLSVSNPRQYNELSVFEIGFKYENPLQAWNEDGTRWCLNALENLESTSTDSTLALFDDVVFVDQPSITINGNLYFENGFGAKKLSTPRLKESRTQETYDGTMLLNLQELQRRLQAIDLEADQFEDVLRNSLQIEGNQTVYGKLRFQDVVFDCERKSCHFDSIQTTILNGEEIGHWNRNLVFLDSEQVINGTLFAENIVASDINVNGMVDGIDSRTLVTKSGDHNITGPKTFTSLVRATDVEVNGLVDGVKISPVNVLLTSGHQTVTGNLMFDDIDVSWLEINGLVNGIDLTKFYEDVVRSDQPSTITGEKIFHDVAVEDLIMSAGTTINGVDLVDLWENALWVEGYQEIKAPLTFHSVNLHKNLNVPSGINGIQIPGPRVVNINEFANVTAPHVFETSTTISQLNVLNSLNGLGTFHIPGQLPHLNIMLKTGGQLVTGLKTFHTIHLDADSSVMGTVNGVDLSELKAMVLRRDSTKDSNSTWTFNNLKIVGPLTVNKISGYDLNYIYDNALKLSDNNVPEVIFKEVVYIDELESNDINGIDIENDLVLLNKPQILTGNKVFQEIILEENNVIIETINNVNITYLTETILKIGNQALKSKVFNGNVKINKLTVKGSVNGVPISEFATLSGDEVLLHSRELTNVTFTEIEANNVEVVGTVNNINIREMMQDTMTYGGQEQVTGRKIIKGTIHVADGDELSVARINGINIRELWDDAVLLDVPQEISGTKTFKAPVYFDNLIFQTIDGVSENDMKNWMLKDVPQTVEGDVVFAQGLSVKNLAIEGYINGIDIKSLDASIVKINEPSVIEGPVTFENLLISKGDIVLSGQIQGIDLSEEAVTKHGNEEITGTKTFTQDLVIEGDATINGLVDNVLIQDLCQNVVLINEEQNITHLTIKGDVTFLGGGTIEGKVAGVDLLKLHEIAVTTEDGELTFSGQKTFDNLTIEGPITIEGKLGGVDLEFLNQTYMSLTRDQDISAQMVFDELNFKGTVSAERLDTENQMINGIDVGKLNRVLRTDVIQSITAEHQFNEIVFDDDVLVVGKVNGLEIPAGLMRRNHTNYVQSPKIFAKPVHVLGDLELGVGKRIQSVDVSEWFKKAVLKDGGIFNIDGYKTFHNLSAIDVSVGGLLDDLEISEDSLLLTYGDQKITGQKTIKGDVEISGSLTVNGLVNGVNLRDLATKTMQQGRSNEITGIKYFSKPLTIGYLEAPTIAGVNIQELERKINSSLDFEHLQHRLEEIGVVVAEMKDAINNQAIVFQYYELFQEFRISTSYDLTYIFGGDCGELLLLSDNSSSKESCSSIRFFSFSEEQQLFVPYPQELLASTAVSVKSMFVWDATYLFVANHNFNPLCSSDVDIGEGNVASEIYIWNNGSKLFQLLQILETRPVWDMITFQDGSLGCVVYIELQQCTVYCSQGQLFQHQETLPTRGGRKASILQTDDQTILVIAAEDFGPKQIYVEDEKSIDIYMWNSELSTFSSPSQVIPSTYAQSVLLMNYETEYSSHIFLVVAEGKMPRVQNQPKLLIYRYEESSGLFLKYQEIRDYGQLEWLVLQTGELVLFVLDSRMGKLKLYQHKGASGFVDVDAVNSLGSVNVHAFIRQAEKDGVDHYLALAGPRVLMAQPSQGVDYAKLLKSKMKGNPRRDFTNY